MVQEIKIYLMVLSVIFMLKIAFGFFIRLFQENPEPLTLTKNEIVLTYLTISYIITFIII